MGNKQAKIDALLNELGLSGEGDEFYYRGYFACFNRQLFYEAHEALEEVWLPARLAAEGNFFKGLIQLAGAFVHLQKGKTDPAIRLLRMARENLVIYPGVHRRLNLEAVRDLIEEWSERLARGQRYHEEDAPELHLNAEVN